MFGKKKKEILELKEFIAYRENKYYADCENYEKIIVALCRCLHIEPKYISCIKYGEYKRVIELLENMGYIL